jgi:diguanylate cyclase (GGDEF)-like protein/PAS domain S-box-containing protein
MQSPAKKHAFQWILEQTPAVLWTTDLNLIFTSSVGAALQKMNLQPGQVVGMSLFDYFQTRDPEYLPLKAHLDALQGKATAYELDFQDRHYQVSVGPLRGPDNVIIGTTGIAFDATERLQAEMALRKSEERYRAFIEQSSEGIWRFEMERPIPINLPEDDQIDMLFKVAYLAECNDVFAQMYGYLKAEDLVGARLGDLMIKEDPQNREYFRACIRSGYRLVDAETHEVDREGNPKHILNNLVYVVENGCVVRAWGTQRDITEKKQAEEAVRDSEARYRQLVELAPDAVMVHSGGLIQFVNPACVTLLGATGAKALIGKSIMEFVHPTYQQLVRERVRSVTEEQKPMPLIEEKLIRLDGSVIDVEVATMPFLSTPGAGIQVVIRDITERKRAEAIQSALYRISERTTTTQDLGELYAAIHQIIGELMDAKNFYIALHDPATRLVRFPYFVDEIDQTPEPRELGRGLTEYILRTGRSQLATPERFTELVEQGEVLDVGAPSLDWLGVPLKSGDRTYGVLVVQSYSEHVRYGERDKDVLTFVSQHIATAIERKRAEETIRHQAYHDALTLLPNRMLFRDRFTQALAQAYRHSQMLAMLFLDLDRFKTINDTLGHAVGDQLLQGVAERLRTVVRDGDTIARLGGDEFMVLVSGVRAVEDVAKIAEKLMHVVRPYFYYSGHELHVTTSIGISLYPHDGTDADTLVKNADIALYRAKEHGRNNYQMYTPSMNARALEQLALENKLRRALERKEFVLHYQPIVDAGSGKMQGMEALVRWDRDGEELLFPGEFIGLAEDTGLIVPLGDWVLYTACAQNKRWQRMGHPSQRVAVNLSARQFQHKSLIQDVTDILNETGLEPRYLELELTESILAKNVEQAAETLLELKNMGIRISIDDFGIGYSSLGYLKRFPLHTLKIDQSFVRDSIISADDASIVSAIISMAHSLKLTVVAEGVETQGQLRLLQSQNCDRLQGRLFSYPLPPDEFVSLLREERNFISGSVTRTE